MKTMIFTKNSKLVENAEKAGVDAVIADWENKGKQIRQQNSGFEVNNDTAEDVARIVKQHDIDVYVRVNQFSTETNDEVEEAISCGASGLILPMARDTSEIDSFNKIVRKRVPVIIQIETISLANKAKDLNKCDWEYAYIGLNDLMLDRGIKNIWQSLFDGTVENICSSIKGRKYGFGGLTVLGGGYPIPIELLIHEYVRLGCDLFFMRRCLKKELLDRNFEIEMKNIKYFFECSKMRGPKAVKFDHEKLYKYLERIING